MSIVAKVKDAGLVIVSWVVIVGLLAIPLGLLTGAAAFSVWVSKWAAPAFVMTFLLSIIMLAPLSLVPAMRRFTAVGFIIASMVFSAIVMIWGLSYTYLVWGIFPVIVGLLFFGVGIVPVAMFAALVHGDWSNLGMFALTAGVALGTQRLGSWLAVKANEREERLNGYEATALRLLKSGNYGIGRSARNDGGS